MLRQSCYLDIMTLVEMIILLYYGCCDKELMARVAHEAYDDQLSNT